MSQMHTLHEHLVLVAGNQPAEHARIEPRKQQQADCAVAGVHLVCREPSTTPAPARPWPPSSRAHLLDRLTESKRLGLGKAVREREILLLLKAARAIDRREQIERDVAVPWCSSWKNECWALLPGSPQTGAAGRVADTAARRA